MASASQTDLWQQAGLPRLRRGVNLGNFLESVFEGADTAGLRVQDEWFTLLKNAGFDFVRLPVRWSGHAAASAPFRIDDGFLGRVAHLTDAALAAGLAVIVNQHHYHELMDDPAGHRERFLAIWQNAGRRFRGYPDGLFLEILNEPTDRLTAPLWNEYLRQAYDVLRAEDASRAIVVGPHDWNNWTGLEALSLAGLERDRRVVVTFHYYDPHPFTHQGAPWVKPPHPTGRRWTGSAEELTALRADFDAALAWGTRAGRPLFIGEFGAFLEHAVPADAVAWTRAVRSEAEKRELGWCYWEFCHGFGIWDRHKKVFKDDLLRALIP